LSRAVAFTGIRQAELIDADDEPTGPGSVAGRTLVSLISPGTELAVYDPDQGVLPWGDYPQRTGYAAVFAADEVGADVTEFEAGQNVFCMGNHRAFQHVAPGAGFPPAIVLPGSLAPEVAVFARLMAVSMATLTTTQARPPAKVIVSGLGIIGNLAAQIFTAMGYEAYAWDPVERRRELAAACGVTTVDAPLGESKSLTGNALLALECSGHEAAVVDCLGCVRKGGELVLVARPWRQKTDITAQKLLDEIFVSFASVRTGWEWQVPVAPAPPADPTDIQSQFAQFARPSSTLELHAAAIRWLDEGRISVGDLADTARPEDADEVYARLASGKHDRLTTLFDWQ
jgi:NADPH:quinone reductase-like Zn-dependent oxidoreductase